METLPSPEASQFRLESRSPFLTIVHFESTPTELPVFPEGKLMAVCHLEQGYCTEHRIRDLRSLLDWYNQASKNPEVELALKHDPVIASIEVAWQKLATLTSGFRQRIELAFQPSK